MKDKKLVNVAIGTLLGVLIALLVIYIMQTSLFMMSSLQFLIGLCMMFILPYCIFVCRNKIHVYIVTSVMGIVSLCITVFYCMLVIQSESMITTPILMTICLHGALFASICIDAIVNKCLKK